MSIFSRQRNQAITANNIASQNTDSHSLSRCEKEFRKDYFSSNLLYFKALLGSRLNGRTNLIESDLPILKEAYDKAHQKVQFEIDLHWRRTTHIWTLILALLVATGTVLGLYLTAKSEQKDFFAVVILIFSIISMIASITSLSMLKVSHKWCRNWELHVVMLEPLFAGKLYQTHLGVGKTRFSMAKLNDVFIWIAFSCWIALFELSILILSSNLKNFLIATLIIYTFISFSGFLIGHAILSEDKDNIPAEITQYGIRPTLNNSYIDKLKINFKILGKQIIYSLLFLLIMLLSMYLLIYYVSAIDGHWNDFSGLMKMNIKNLFPYFF